MADQKSGQGRGRPKGSKGLSRTSLNRPRIPPTDDSLQVNFCKNIACENFGIPAVEKSDPCYTITGDVRFKSPKTNQKGDATGRQLKCKCCGSFNPIKNNQSINETARSLNWLPDNWACPNEECDHHHKSVNDHPKSYYKKGKTQTGNQRFQCRLCMKSFTCGRRETVSSRGKLHHRYVPSIMQVVNKMGMNRILETVELQPSVLYYNIDRAYKACLRFNQERESRLSSSSSPIQTLRLCSDRQTYNVNWSKRQDKRNIMLRALATADTNSGYIFPVHVNYDPRANNRLLTETMVANGDHELSPALRQHAQYWLESDYRQVSFSMTPNSQTGSILQDRYNESQTRLDVELPEDNCVITSKLPSEGMQLREDYVMYAHYRVLGEMFSSIPNLCFYTEQESGIRAAIMGNFIDRIQAKQVRYFYLDYAKSVTVDEREKAQRDGKKIRREAAAYYGCGEEEAIDYLLVHAMENSTPVGRYHDRWFRFPIPTYSEPEKVISHMTHFENDNLMDVAVDAKWATLLPVDNFFQIVRRRISLLERHITSAANEGRRWYGNAPYSPSMIPKLLEILRTYYNYCAMNDKKRVTPAMKLGLAKGIVHLRDILEPRKRV